jgi:hypothetical protein
MKTFAVLLWDCVLMTKRTVTIEAMNLEDANVAARKRWGSQVSKISEVSDLQEEEA